MLDYPSLLNEPDVIDTYGDTTEADNAFLETFAADNMQEPYTGAKVDRPTYVEVVQPETPPSSIVIEDEDLLELDDTVHFDAYVGGRGLVHGDYFALLEDDMNGLQAFAHIASPIFSPEIEWLVTRLANKLMQPLANGKPFAREGILASHEGTLMLLYPDMDEDDGELVSLERLAAAHSLAVKPPFKLLGDEFFNLLTVAVNGSAEEANNTWFNVLACYVLDALVGQTHRHERLWDFIRRSDGTYTLASIEGFGYNWACALDTTERLMFTENSNLTIARSDRDAQNYYVKMSHAGKAKPQSFAEFLVCDNASELRMSLSLIWEGLEGIDFNDLVQSIPRIDPADADFIASMLTCRRDHILKPAYRRFLRELEEGGTVPDDEAEETSSEAPDEESPDTDVPEDDIPM